MIYQAAYRIPCPCCGNPDAHLHVAYPYTEPRRRDQPVVVTFSCVNQGQDDHGNPSDEQLLELLPPMATNGWRPSWWQNV